MSDTPPPELVDACARAELNWDERLSIEEGGEEPWLAAAPDDREVYREGVRRILAALAEWADGGLIDPSTWTVVEAERLGQVSVRRDGESWGYVPDEPMEPFSLSTPELSDEAWQIIEEAKRRPPARHFEKSSLRGDGGPVSDTRAQREGER